MERRELMRAAVEKGIAAMHKRKMKGYDKRVARNHRYVFVMKYTWTVPNMAHTPSTEPERSRERSTTNSGSVPVDHIK